MSDHADILLDLYAKHDPGMADTRKFVAALDALVEVAGLQRSSRRVPFSEPTETDEWETAAARVSCENCGEWVYVRRRKGAQGPHALPPDCQVCGAPLDDPSKRDPEDVTR